VTKKIAATRKGVAPGTGKTPKAPGKKAPKSERIDWKKMYRDSTEANCTLHKVIELQKKLIVAQHERIVRLEGVTHFTSYGGTD
jgi:hypothetical protein